MEEQNNAPASRSLNRLDEATAQLIVNISSALMRADLATIDAELTRSLQLVGRQLNVDAMSLCVVEGKLLKNTARWRASKGWLDPPLDVDLNQAKFVRSQFEDNRDIVADTLSNLPNDAHYERALFSSRHVASMAAVPVPGIVNPHGYVIAEALETPRPWKRGQLALLDMFASTVGAVIERRIYYRKLVERERMAREAERRQNQILTVFAHELRAPLTAIIGYSEMIAELSSGPDAEQQKRYLRDLLDSAHNMSAFISDTLSLARIDGGEVSLMLTRFDIVEVIKGAVRQVMPRARSSSLQISSELPEPGEHVRGDRSKITQLVTNLLDNALKFTPQKGKVTVRLTVREHDYDIEVTDTGIGIAKQDQNRIFHRFEQLPNPASHGRSSGIGLGLALVKRLAELHEGDVFVDSTPKKGSSFRVTMKRRPTPPKPGTGTIRSFFD